MALERLGPYRIRRQLGQGGMGTVYEAVNEQTGEAAAVKVLSQLLGSHENFRLRFESEIETLKRLKHPTIVQLLGFGEQDGHLFYAMELVDGTSLHEELKKGRRFTWQEVIRMGVALAGALKLAHDSGVIHRDLKPANLMLTRDGQIKLMDFGIARLFGSTQLTADGGVVGTIDFMSPEQAEGQPVTPRADLYSLGAVFYALLAGRPPFIGKSLPQIIHALRFDTPIPLNRLAPETPEELALLIDQLLEKDPKKRVPTALILSNRLKAIEHGLKQRSERAANEDDSDEYQLAGDPQTVLEPRPGVTRPGRAAPSSTRADIPNDSPETIISGATPAPPAEPLDDRLTWNEATHVSNPAPKSNPAKSGAPGVDTRNRPTLVDEPPAYPSAAPSHFTTIDEDERRRSRRQREEVAESRRYAWLQIVAVVLMVALLCVGLWWLTRPASANTLYTRVAAAAALDDPAELESLEGDLDTFLATYASDSRADEIRAWKEQVVAARETRKLARRAKQAKSTEFLSACERLYAEAIQLSGVDPDGAIRRLEALIDVYQSAGESEATIQRTLELAKQQIESLRTQARRQQTEDLEQLRQRLDWADERRAAAPDEAEKVYRGVITLYGERAWAAECVERARSALEQR